MVPSVGDLPDDATSGVLSPIIHPSLRLAGLVIGVRMRVRVRVMGGSWRVRCVRLPSAVGRETNTRRHWGVGVRFHEVTRSINFKGETREDQRARKGEEQKK